MNGTDKFFIEVTAAQLADICDTSKTDAPAIVDESELIYIDPVRFEAHVKAQRAELWPAEFRQARDIIQDYAQRSDEHKEIFNAALICLHALALQMIPEHAGEIKADEAGTTPAPDDPAAGAVKIPEKFTQIGQDKNARLLMGALVKAGYLTQDGQPADGVMKKEAAYIAYLICNLLGVGAYCKTFGPFWNYEKNENLANDKSNTKADDEAKFNNIIAPVIEQSETLRERPACKDFLARINGRSHKK